MKQWNILFQKEMTELWRNRKWIWVPLIFTLLAVMDPLTYYFLPEIIEYAGGVPDGTMIELPKLSASEIIMTSLEELSMFGVIVIALITMGTIAGERKLGQSEMVLVRPISYTNYVTAKWVAYLILVWTSLMISMLLSWYYTNLLFGDLSFILLIKIIGFYGIWLTFVVTVAFVYHSFCSSSGVVAACTIFTIVIMSGINMAFGHQLTLFPNQLSAQIGAMIATDNIPKELSLITGIILFLIVILIIIAINTFKQREVVQN